MWGPVVVNSEEVVLCECEGLEDKTLFEKVCIFIWAVPCGFLVFLWKAIPLLCNCVYETTSSVVSLIWDYVIFPLLRALWSLLLYIYTYILSPTWNYVLVPTANICLKIGTLMFEYGIFPFWPRGRFTTTPEAGGLGGQTAGRLEG